MLGIAQLRIMANRETDSQGNLCVSILRQGVNERCIKWAINQRRVESHPIFVRLNLLFVRWSLQAPKDTKSRYNLVCGSCLAKTLDDRMGLLVVHLVLDGACFSGCRGG